MIAQSKLLRQRYQQQLDEQQLVTRKVLLKYYETLLQSKPKYHKCAKSQNKSVLSQSIKIPKVEASCRDLSELKISLFALNQSTECHYQLERLADLMQIKLVKSLTAQFHEVGRVLRFIDRRMQNTQRRVLNSLIRNYNNQVQKQQYNRVAQSFQIHIKKQFMRVIFSEWKQIYSEQKKQILQVFLRHYFNAWKSLPPPQVELQRFFKIWREYVEMKKGRRLHNFIRLKTLFEFWKMKTSRTKVKIRQEIISKNHYQNTLKLCVFGLLQQNILLNRREKAQQDSNEFISNSQIQTIKIQQ